MLLFSGMFYMLVRYASPNVLEVPNVDFIRPCGVVVFGLFYSHLDLCCGECYFGLASGINISKLLQLGVQQTPTHNIYMMKHK